jgi:hypothetical protein
VHGGVFWFHGVHHQESPPSSPTWITGGLVWFVGIEIELFSKEKEKKNVSPLTS